MASEAPVTIIGIDCATQPKSVGLARAEWNGGRAEIFDVTLGDAVEDIARHMAGWVSASERALVALDSPLGWPAALGGTLAEHRAGQPVGVDPAQLFKRETDRIIKQRVGKQPLEVGADRIARTAVASLRLLADIGDALGQTVRLAWDHTDLPQVSAIEVYPAATLESKGIASVGYKKAEQREVRGNMVEELREHLVLPGDLSLAHQVDHALDAIVCALAAQDFLEGRAAPPDDLARARKEGWIWAAAPVTGR